MNIRPYNLKIVLVFALLIIFGCTETNTISVEHPILNMEVVEIPSIGKVVFIEGDAEILKKERHTEYQKVEVDTIVSKDDILRMKPGCVTKIEFEDGSFIINEKQEKEAFITFEFVKTDNEPKER